MLIFLAMGCAAFGIWGQLVVSVPLPALRLLVAGGLTYICGVPFFIYGEVSPFGLFESFMWYAGLAVPGHNSSLSSFETVYVSYGTGPMVGGPVLTPTQHTHNTATQYIRR